MALEILVETGSGKWLVAWRHQAITWTNVDLLVVIKVLWHSSEDIITIRFEDTNQ